MGTLAYKIVIKNDPSPLDGRFVRIVGSKLVINRMIYKKVGSVEFNYSLDPNVVTNGLIGSFFERMNEFNEGPVTDQAMIELNKYLGSLGVNESYPLRSDMITLNKKINYIGFEINLGPIYEGRK